MKRYAVLLSLIVSLLFIWGCDSVDGDGVVKLDGPILEKTVYGKGVSEFSGYVVNTGNTAVNSVYVVVVLKDDKGNIIREASTSIFREGSNTPLNPSERQPFALLVESDPGEVFTKEAEVYYEDIANNSPIR